MLDEMVVQSHKGPYTVYFHNTVPECPMSVLSEASAHFLVDANVARLYRLELAAVLNHPNSIVINATEDAKSIEQVIPIIEKLVANKVRRGQNLIAIGGGIIQDITCFIASTLLRGLDWKFVPTTLLAQADSCIGSKSSINLGATKNILGTFNPPSEIYVCQAFLNTLEQKDILSGIGEILKVHAIEGKMAFDQLVSDYNSLLSDRATMLRYIGSSLRIKQKFIEVDEFDRGIRNIFNYGHSFGHAIESATDYGVPHGIAVSMGMELANSIACQRGLLPEREYQRMHHILRKHYSSFSRTVIPLHDLLEALMKDKKNTATKLVLIFAIGDDARIERTQVDADEAFHAQCRQALSGIAA
jgi:3-dehydroquinate synthase